MLKIYRGGSRTAATSKMELFVIIVNGYYHKVLHLGCCSSPRSASANKYGTARRKLCRRPEVYSELSQTSKMERIVKIVDGFQPLIIFAKGTILEICRSYEYVLEGSA